MAKFMSKRCGEFEVLEDKGWRNITIRFIDTGYTTVVQRNKLYEGSSVKDPYAPTVEGVGYLGEGCEPKDFKNEYRLWKNIITRCYRPEQLIKKPNYVGCSLSEDWKCFATFVSEIPSIPGYEDWVSGKDVQLDKDLKIKGNKVYSKEACSFIASGLNAAYTTRALNKEVKK